MKFIDFEGLTRFEKARLISTRALQISMGAPTLVEEKGSIDPIKVARKEFEKDLIPLSIKPKNPPKMA